MSQLTINHRGIGAQVYELSLKPGQSLNDAVQAGQNDGLDQVYFKANEKLYFAEGDGLHLSALKERALPTVQLELNGVTQKAQILSVDDETNTAWEGTKALGKAAGGLLVAGLIGGTATTAIGLKTLNSNITVLNKAASILPASLPAAQQGLSQLAKTAGKLTQETLVVTIAKPTSQLKMTMPSNFKEMVTKLEPVSQGARKAQVEIAKASTSVGQVQKTAQAATQSTSLVKKGLYVAAIGVGIASLALAGGSLYGALRGQDEHALDAFRGQLVGGFH